MHPPYHTTLRPLRSELHTSKCTWSKASGGKPDRDIPHAEGNGSSHAYALVRAITSQDLTNQNKARMLQCILGVGNSSICTKSNTSRDAPN
eukprot:708610-Amphidinium_carterae.1